MFAHCSHKSAVLNSPFLFGPHFLSFCELYAKKLDLGIPSKSSGRQHGTQNRPSGAKELPKSIQDVLFSRSKNWPAPQSPQGLLFDNCLCIWGSPRHHFWTFWKQICRELTRNTSKKHVMTNAQLFSVLTFWCCLVALWLVFGVLLVSFWYCFGSNWLPFAGFSITLRRQLLPILC